MNITLLSSTATPSTMLSIAEVHTRLQQNARLAHTVSLSALSKFITYTAALRNDIILVQPPKHSPAVPPSYLPDAIRFFLSESINVSVDIVDSCWHAFKDIVWDHAAVAEFTESPIDSFWRFGQMKGIG